MKNFSVFSIFQSGMVLQRQKPIPIWGTAPSGSLITVFLSRTDVFDRVQAQTSAQPDGTWHCSLPPQEAGEDCALTISCGGFSDEMLSCDTSSDTVISLKDISIGDVWLACGQSNMEFFLRYEESWETIQNYPKNPKIHMYNVPQLAFPGQQKDTAGWGKWLTEGDAGFETFSAPGYSFARHIQPHIHVPIGIIGCNWGGTTASAWLDEAFLQEAPLNCYLDEYDLALNAYSPDELEQVSLKGWEFETSEKHGKDFMPLMYGREVRWQEQYIKDHAEDPVIPSGPWSINRPGGLFHQMLEPLIPFAIKGALWYQGESDACHADIYDRLLTALISCWREKWNDPFPFLFVQLAPFGRWLECDSTNYCKVRAKQALVSKSVPDTGMVSLMDIGSYYDIHPKKKMEVGRRLALLARGLVYRESILCESPELIGIDIKHCPDALSSIYLTFSNCSQLTITELSTKPLDVPEPEEIAHASHRSYSQLISSDEIRGFQIIQNGRSIPIQNIVLENDQVILQADIAPQLPCTVSLAWADYAVVNLVNEMGLPIRPFTVTR